jgi:hypothetical protein
MPKVMFFLGAGASMFANAPDTKVCIGRINDALRDSKTLGKQYYNTYVELCNYFGNYRPLNEGYDLEDVYTLLDDYIKKAGKITFDFWELQQIPKKQLSNLDIDYFRFNLIHNASNEFEQQNKLIQYTDRIRTKINSDLNLMKKLKEEIQKEIYNQYHEIVDHNHNTLKNLNVLFAPIIENNIPLKDWAIFSTNYDTIIEEYFTDVIEKEIIEDGFILRNNRQIFNKNTLSHSRKVKFYKLHGSVDWRLTTKKNIIRGYGEVGDTVFGQEKIAEKVLIYPIKEKITYDKYKDVNFTQQLFNWIKKADIIISVGFSFRDGIIREAFQKGLEKEKDKTLIIIDPNGKQIINNYFMKCKAKIMMFGVPMPHAQIKNKLNAFIKTGSTDGMILY